MVVIVLSMITCNDDEIINNDSKWLFECNDSLFVDYNNGIVDERREWQCYYW